MKTVLKYYIIFLKLFTKKNVKQLDEPFFFFLIHKRYILHFLSIVLVQFPIMDKDRGIKSNG